MAQFIKKYVGICFFLFLVFIVIMPREGHSWDSYCWQQWTIYNFQYGLGHIYDSGTDYLPLYHYILSFFGYIQGSVPKIESNIYLLKSITLQFHFITGFILALLIKEKNDSWDKVLLNVLYYLLNVALLYNTLIWGQVDAIMTCMVFISFYFAWKKNVIFTLLFLLISINFKLQAIVFVPVLGIISLPTLIQKFSFKRLIGWIAVPAIVQLLILMPFILTGTIDKVWNVVTGSVGKFPVVSMNAYNIWDYLLSGDLMQTPDNAIKFGLTLKSWGLLLFFIASAITLFPLLKQAYEVVISKKLKEISKEKALLSMAIVPLLFFYFNTQMHERYTHPAFIFLIAYSISSKKSFVAILGCVTYFLNLEGTFKFLDMNNYHTLIFDRDFISSLFLLTIVLLSLELYEVKLGNLFKRADKKLSEENVSLSKK